MKYMYVAEDKLPPAIHIQGYRSYQEWQAAGYPGAKSFAPERPLNRRAGLCTYPGCNNVTYGRNGSLRLKLCGKHRYTVPNKPYVRLADR